MNKIDPQRTANEMMTRIKKFAKIDGYDYWTMVGECGLSLEKSVQGDPIIDPKQSVTTDGERPKRMSKRTRADLMKVAAILQDAAQQHKALQRYENAPTGEAVAELIRSINSD